MNNRKSYTLRLTGGQVQIILRLLAGAIATASLCRVSGLNALAHTIRKQVKAINKRRAMPLEDHEAKFLPVLRYE